MPAWAELSDDVLESLEIGGKTAIEVLQELSTARIEFPGQRRARS